MIAKPQLRLVCRFCNKPGHGTDIYSRPAMANGKSSACRISRLTSNGSTFHSFNRVRPGPPRRTKLIFRRLQITWRATTAPQWQHSRFVGMVTEYTLENIVIDNYLFGVTAVGKNGDESTVSFPTGVFWRRR